MEVSEAAAKNGLAALIRGVKAVEQIVIVRPLAEIAASTPEPRRPVLGGMKGRMKLMPGWSDSITEAELLGEDV